ncbi:MAG: hypothetical protein JEY79_12085 [Pseudodesulfovibrio sp.]|nr:hypothetical protein [Pseudodesulfovibrio sp.]
MTWTAINLSTPSALQAVHTGLQECHSFAPGELDNSKARLAAINGSANIAPNPVAATASGIDALRQSMKELLQSDGRFVCTHPYLHPLGDRRGNYSYLTPQQAVEGMAAKLADPMDLPPNGDLQGVFLLLRGVDNQGFADTLGTFNTIFPVTELQLAERRAAWLATLEKDKLIQATGPIHPTWHEQDPRRHEGGKNMDTTLGPLVAMAEGYNQENIRPETELDALIEKKRAHLQTLDDAWTNLTATLQGGTGLGLVLDGNSGSIHRQLLENTPPVEGYKLAAACCWIGESGQMTFFRELLGL